MTIAKKQQSRAYTAEMIDEVTEGRRPVQVGRKSDGLGGVSIQIKGRSRRQVQITGMRGFGPQVR